MNEALLQLAGRLHPMVLHLPIGVLVGAIVIELWARLRGRAPERGVRLVLIWLLVASAAAAVASGLLLSEEPGYVADAFFLHKWLGILTGVALLVAAACATVGFDRGYLGVLLSAGVLIIPTGHLGASMTHGRDFLTAPFATPGAARVIVRADTDGGPVTDGAADAPAGPSWYAAEIAPILAAHCTACHGATRRKSGLALHTPPAIAEGGSSGPVLTTDAARPHALIRRVRLPAGHDEHMPPEGKPQPSPAQVAALVRWVEAGAPFEEPPPADAALVALPAERSSPPSRPLPAGAIAALRAAHVHAEVIDPESNGLWIDFTAAGDLDAATIVRLLAPVAGHTQELSLRGVAAADEVLAGCAPWERLRRLDLSGADVGRGGLVAAADAGGLEELALVGATLTPDAVEALAGLDTIDALHAWGAELPPAMLAALRARPGLTLNEGDVEPPEPIEVEPPITFGEPAGLASLAAVNSECPVTGAPVDARFTIVHEGRVVGFCCKVCPGKFWDDPDAFPVPDAEPATVADRDRGARDR